MKKILFLLLFSSCLGMLHSQPFPVYTNTLKNGLQVIVYEKPGNDFAEVQVWYKTGSKDEHEGIRGMAHMFEHMMFRGTKKYPGNFFDVVNRKFGWQSNAYTAFDQTVYHEYVPLNSLDTAFDIEADRMSNLVVSQDILNTERQVVGEEYRNGRNNWYEKLFEDIYPFLYPKGHPYEVDVIGNLDEITSFTTEQCMRFYNNFYSPDNAYLIVVGNMKAEEVFTKAEKYFGGIDKHCVKSDRTIIPDVFSTPIKIEEMIVQFPVQIYSLAVPAPVASDKDFPAFKMLTEILFTDPNSILNNRLVKQEFSAYGIQMNSNFLSLYPSMLSINVIMEVKPGNIKVKKAIKDEINKVIENGIENNRMASYIKSIQSTQLLGLYNAGDIAAQLGIFQYYYNDCRRAFTMADQFKNISSDDLKRVAEKYYQPDKLQFINIKPE